MAEKQLTDNQALALSGTTDPDFGTNATYPTADADPWLLPMYRLMHQTLKAFAAVANNLRVFEDDANDTTIGIVAGRCTINSVVTTYAGGTIDLVANDNDVTYVWIEDSGGGTGVVNTATDASGWPGGNHIKLAEVTISAGAITGILDRRVEQMLHN